MTNTVEYFGLETLMLVIWKLFQDCWKEVFNKFFGISGLPYDIIKLQASQKTKNKR